MVGITKDDGALPSQGLGGASEKSGLLVVLGYIGAQTWLPIVGVVADMYRGGDLALSGLNPLLFSYLVVLGTTACAASFARWRDEWSRGVFGAFAGALAAIAGAALLLVPERGASVAVAVLRVVSGALLGFGRQPRQLGQYLFAPLKHARLDYMVQKAVEMGAGSLRPVFTRRTQAARVNAERMHANAVEAAEQCGILTIPDIVESMSLSKALASFEEDRLLVFCDEDAPSGDPHPSGVGAGHDHQPLAGDRRRQHGAVVAPAQPFVVEGLAEDVADELDHRAAAAAMGEVDAAVTQVEGSDVVFFHRRAAPR